MLSECKGQQFKVCWRLDEGGRGDAIWWHGPCKMADSYTSFKPRIDDSSSVDRGSSSLQAEGSYWSDELVHSGEGKRQPECQRQSEPSKAEEGQEEEEGGGRCKLKGRLLPRPSLFLAPTLKCDGGDDAATAAAVLTVRLVSSVRTGRRVPGSVVVVVLGVVRRTDGEAQLCITWVVKTIWESTTHTHTHGKNVFL